MMTNDSTVPFPVPPDIQVLKTNAFCPTGKGGGVDPTCSPKQSLHKLNVTYGGSENSVGAVLFNEVISQIHTNFPDLAAKLSESISIRLESRIRDMKGPAFYENGIMAYHPNLITDIKKRGKDEFDLGGSRVNKSSAGIVRHEVGHHVQRVLGLEKDRKWRSLFDQASSISAYAKVDPFEMFAESFAAYTHPTYRTGDLPPKVESYFAEALGKRLTTNSSPTITSLTATDSNGNEFRLPKSAITNELVQSLTTNATVRPNPLLMDPTGTGKERKALERAIMSRLKMLKQAIVETIVTEDVFGLKDRPSVYTSNLASTQVDITDPKILTTILDIQNRIDPADLVEFEDKSHITVRYGLHDLDPERVEWIVSQHSSVRAKLGGLSIFPAKESNSQRGGPEFDVLKIDVSSKDLESINRHLGILPNTTTHPDYHPHLTIAYLKPGTGQKYVGESGLEGVELEFKSMVYSDDDRKKAEMVFNAFCPTGKGGGVDPSCGKGKDGVKGQSTLKREPSGVDTLVDVAGYRLTALRNPSVEQAVGLLQKLQKEAEGDPFKFAELRALSDGKNIWIWSGGAVLHDTAADALGLDYRRLAGGGGLLKMKEEGTVRFFFHRYKETGSYLSDGNFITINAGIWEFVTDDQKVEEFIKWIRSQMSVAVLGTMTTLGTTDPDHWLMKHIQDTYTKGMGKVFEFIRKPIFAEKMPHYEGTKAEFLKSAFTRPVSPNRVKLLAGRAYSELSGMTDKMATQMQRSLTDGFIRGESPRDIARQLVKDVDGLGRKQANMIASTEITRAYNEGQLDSMEELGVEDVGVSVEWRVSKQGVTVLGNPSPCPVCAPLNGIVLKISEARGLLPRHPHCRCAWVASGVGESTKGQKRSQQRIVQAVKSSLLAERPKRKKTTAKPSRWAGSKAKIGKNRPKSILD